MCLFLPAAVAGMMGAPGNQGMGNITMGVAGMNMGQPGMMHNQMGEATTSLTVCRTTNVHSCLNVGLPAPKLVCKVKIWANTKALF